MKAANRNITALDGSGMGSSGTLTGTSKKPTSGGENAGNVATAMAVLRVNMAGGNETGSGNCTDFNRDVGRAGGR